MDEMHRTIGVTRKSFLTLSGAGLVTAAVASGCDLLSTDPEAGQDEQGGDVDAREAPMLAQRVEAGELPPVEERMPDEPMVVEPVDRVGSYGGEWRTTLQGTADVPWIYQTIGYENLVRWHPEWPDGDASEVLPNLAESFEVNEDGTVYTFALRQGVRWSDGEPFDADDIIFAVEDVLLNDELYPAPPSVLTSGDEPATIEKVDDYTVRFTFSEPKGFFLQDLATSSGRELTSKPRHYLEEFHQDYNSDIDTLVENEGAADWVQLFEGKGGTLDLFWQTTAIPSLDAWVLTTAVGDDSPVTAERNPYYWKTDPDGRQLPYIDTVVYDIIDDPEVMLTRALNGDVDMQLRHFNTVSNRPVLANNREEGNYDFFTLTEANMNTAMICLNLTSQDPVKREIFGTKDFRIGLSHAINREEIIDAVFQRQGEPWQGAPLPDSPFYDEQLAKQYTEYDVDLANQHLDRAGFTERDGDGFRLGPDGQPIAFNILVRSDFRGGIWLDLIELVVGYWREVGVEAHSNTVDRTLYTERVREAAEYDAALFNGPGGLDVFLSPMHYFPYGPGSEFAPRWYFWYLDPDDPLAEEPPEQPRRQMELYDQVLASHGPSERNGPMTEILDIAREQFYAIGICTYGDSGYGIVKNNFHNVPDPMVHSANFANPGPTHPEQYFISDE